eukprot:TRINITY_DN40888_c0_g1_i1.p2 TRINITY_DN40888_c0_g1~~TRINITY_DN40888_c0_g1_i1.p2  ORF type:complete len:160 (-),score=47.63 TRINITY_DN40888_c0_g1_i1:56-535(-)
MDHLKNGATAKGMDAATVENYWNVFKSFDEDESGAIDSNEVHRALKSAGISAPPEKIRDIMAELDTDKSGGIDFDEFIVMARKLKNNPSGLKASKSLASVAKSKVAMFEELGKDKGPGFSKKKTFGRVPNSMPEGTYKGKTATKFDKPPPEKKSLKDLP